VKTVGISTVKNEADIIEAMVRHNLAYVDRLVVVDNGSTDGTLDVLRSLSRERLPLDVLEDGTPGKYQSRQLTSIMRKQAVEYGAEWIFPLDADEFLLVPEGQKDVIPNAADRSAPLLLQWRIYSPTSADDPQQPNPVRRLRHCYQQQSPLTKIVVPAAVAKQSGAVIPQGSHEVLVDGKPVSAVEHPYVQLAHFPVRSRGQWTAKVVVNSLQYRTMGSHADADKGPAYRQIYQQFCQGVTRTPDWFFEAARKYMSHADVQTDQPLIEQPIRYAGTALRYSASTDDDAYARMAVLAYADALATRYGYLRSKCECQTADAEEERDFALFHSQRIQLQQLLGQLEEKELCIQQQHRDILRLNAQLSELRGKGWNAVLTRWLIAATGLRMFRRSG
jgi:hypothetical protein